MIQKILISVGVSLCLCLPFSAEAQRSKTTQTRKARTTQVQKKARDQHPPTVAEKSIEPGVRRLLADGFTFEEKASVANAIREKEAEEALRAELLEYPAIDLYGENTWNRHVNPFGRSVADIPATYDIDCSGFVMPLDKDVRVTSNFGYRKRFGRNHYGIDLGLRTGDTVRVCFDGKVRIRDYEGKGYGHYVVIRHPNGLETVYGHLSRPLVHENQIVKAGTAIGLGGSTGRSTGPHLHLETRFMGIPINPALIIDFAEGSPKRDFYTFRHRGGRSVDRESLGVSLVAEQIQEDSDLSHSTTYAEKKKSVEKKRKTKSTRQYTVKSGDSLYIIAKRHKTSVTNLCKANKMSSKSTLKPGQKIVIP